MTRIKIKQGFTLAEVLITLVIIGIIAAMTIPALINQTNNQEYVSKLQKAYSTLNQAYKMVQSEHGDIAVWGNINDARQAEFVSYFQPYMSIAKICGSDGGCWAKTKSLANVNALWSSANCMGSPCYSFVLADGTSISLDSFADTTLAGPYYGFPPQETFPNLLVFYVDVNGMKGPNVLGKDVYLFGLYPEKGFIPAGAENGSVRCRKNATGDAAGYDCTAKVLKEKKIDY